MAEYREQRIGRLTIRIDRHLCVGFGDCIDVAADLFEMDADGVVTFRSAPGDAEDLALRACAACPVDALSAIDATGRTVAP